MFACRDTEQHRLPCRHAPHERGHHARKAQPVGAGACRLFAAAPCVEGAAARRAGSRLRGACVRVHVCGRTYTSTCSSACGPLQIVSSGVPQALFAC